MTQQVHSCCKDMCKLCRETMDKPCAWLSLGNEYCDEIIRIDATLCHYKSKYFDLQKRIDKAVEYCKETLDLKEEYNNEVECVVNDLLDILRGKDE